MRSLLKRLFTENWQRKLLAFVSAIVIYMLVSHSITSTITVTNIPVRVVNLPANKTVVDMLPDGTLARRMSVTLTGRKSALSLLEPGDLEVIVDGGHRTEDWVLKLSRRNLVSLNPEVDLIHSVTELSHGDFLIKLSRLVTEKVPVTIGHPIGEPPRGYQYLDTWPQKLEHTISGPEDKVEELQLKGLELTLDLSKISLEELEDLSKSAWSFHEDEVSYPVPASWKMVAIPFLNDTLQSITDPDAQRLTINFLRQDLVPLDSNVPIRVYFPTKYSASINPLTHHLQENDLVAQTNGIYALTIPLYARGVSRFFVDVVRDNLEINVMAAPRSEKKRLDWSVQVVNPEDLEDHYVTLLSPNPSQNDYQAPLPQMREDFLRQRFREYMRTIHFFTYDDAPLSLDISLKGNNIHISSSVSSSVKNKLSDVW